MKTFKTAAILCLLLLSHLASAHSVLKNSTPENGDMLSKPPEDLMLEFTMEVKLVKLQLIEQSGKPIKLMAKPSKDFETTFTIALPMLDSSNYKVEWIAMGKDAHKTKGDFTFTLHASDMKQMQMPASSAGHDNNYD